MGFHARQHATALGNQRVDQHPAAARAPASHRPSRAGHLQQQLLVLVIGRDIVEQLDHGIRRAEYRDAGFLEYLPGAGHLRAAHEAAAQGGPAVAGDVDQALGHRLGRHQGQRREHDEDGIDLRVLGELAGGFQVAFAACVTAQVDRVVALPFARQQRLERRDRGRGQRRQRNAQAAGAVGRHARRAGAVAENGQPAAARVEARGQGAGGVEQLAEVAHADDAGAAHCRVEHLVGQFGGIGVGHLVADMVARLEQDHRLDAGGRTQGADEAPGVADLLDVEQDVAGALVVGQVVEHLAEIDIHRLAQRYGQRQADAVHGRPVEHRGAHGAGLRDQRQVAGQGGDLGEGGVQRRMRADDAERLGAEEADTGIERGIADAPLGGGAVGGHAGRVADDDGVAHPGPAALRNDLGDGARRGGDDGQVDRPPGRLDAHHAGLVEHRRVARIDGDEAPLVAVGEQVLQDDVADAARLLGGADHGNGARGEQAGEVVG